MMSPSDNSFWSQRLQRLIRQAISRLCATRVSRVVLKKKIECPNIATVNSLPSLIIRFSEISASSITDHSATSALRSRRATIQVVRVLLQLLFRPVRFPLEEAERH